MHPDWHKFLRQQDAVFDHDRVACFGGNAPVADKTGHDVTLADLSGLEGFIAVTGPERREFLQGQLSTDIRRLTPELSQSSSWNNAKGRVVTTLRAYEQADAIRLALPYAMLAPVITGLRVHVLRSKVVLTDISDQSAGFGAFGDETPGLLRELDFPVPETDGGVTSSHGIQLVRLHGALPRFAVHGEVARVQAVWTRLREHGAHAAGSTTWTLQRILAGEPCIHPATSGRFVAQMLGLEELGAVHFNKGCYLGQEVIARAHYRGTVKRHLYRASCKNNIDIFPGIEIMDTARSAAAGEVVDACRDNGGQWQLLAVLHEESVNAPLQVNGTPINLVS